MISEGGSLRISPHRSCPAAGRRCSQLCCAALTSNTGLGLPDVHLGLLMGSFGTAKVLLLHAHPATTCFYVPLLAAGLSSLELLRCFSVSQDLVLLCLLLGRKLWGSSHLFCLSLGSALCSQGPWGQYPSDPVPFSSRRPRC